MKTISGLIALLLAASTPAQAESQTIMRFGAALGAASTSAQEIVAQFQRLLTGEPCAAGARQFADRYATFDAQRQLEAIVERLEELGRSR